MSDEIANFINALHEADLEMTGEEVAETLWLATRLTPMREDQPSVPYLPMPPLFPPEPDPTVPRDETPIPNYEFGVGSNIYPHALDPIDRDEASRDEASQSGKLIRMPTASALADSLVLGRALRPLRRPGRSRTRFVLDEEATVYQIAEMQKKVLLPVIEPAPERWFELALVIDEGASMIFWQQTIAELCTFFEQLGAFRDIRLWKLLTDNREEAQIYVGADSATGTQRLRDPKELIDPTGRRLILVVTDCVSPAWYSGKVQALLELWGAKNLVTLLQMLPQRFWPRTALCAAQRIHLTASAPGIANAQLKTSKLLFRLASQPASIPLPIVTLHQQSLGSWARMVMGAENTKAAGVLFAKNLDSVFAVTSLSQSEKKEPTPQERVRHFRAAASPTALELACLLSATPIILPIVRVIQETMLSEPEPAYDPPEVSIAEVFLGGLLKEIHRDPPTTHPEYVEYEFLPGVREELARALPGADRYRVLREVSAFMEKHFGLSHDFLARYAVPNASGEIFISPESHPFAKIAVSVWRELGGEYAQLADMLERQVNDHNKPEDTTPPQAKKIVEELKQAPNEKARVATLDSLLVYLPGIWPSEIIQQVLEIIPRLASLEQRKEVLSRLLEHVPTAWQAEIEQQIQQLHVATTNTIPDLTIKIPPATELPAMRRNTLRFTRVVCPSCFEEIYLGDCRIVSGRTGRVLRASPQGWLGQQRARLQPEDLSSPGYTAELARYECTNCGYHLPPNVDSVPSIALAVVGDVYAGKSHYIASLLYLLRTQGVGQVQGITQLTCLTPTIEEAYRRSHLEPLYGRKQILPLTRPATETTANPLIYQLSATPASRRVPPNWNLMIYDASGEDFQQDRLVRFARFIFNAGAFICVADPVMIPPILEQLPKPLQDNIHQSFGPVVTRRTAERISVAIDIFERYHGGEEAASRNTPLAVMLSKADLFKYLNELNSLPFSQEPSYNNGLDLRDIDAVDQEVRDLLRRYRQADLLAASSRFKHVKFFATSATGGPPDADGNFQQIEPFRCLDPLLWILYCYGIIQARA